MTAQSGGTLDAGNAGSAGLLTLASGLSLNTGATLGVQLGGTTPGTGYDQIREVGQLTLGGTLSVTEPNGFKLTLGQTFVLLNDTGTSLVTTTFANAPGGLYTDAAGNTGSSTFTVKVVDSQAPVLTLPSAMVVDAMSRSPWSHATAKPSSVTRTVRNRSGSSRRGA